VRIFAATIRDDRFTRRGQKNDALKKVEDLRQLGASCFSKVRHHVY
jgi:hypothetical protein